MNKKTIDNQYYFSLLLYIFPLCIFFDFSIGYFDDREFWVIGQALVLFSVLFFGIFFKKIRIY